MNEGNWKMNNKYKRICLCGVLLVLDILLSWFAFCICDMWLSSILGPDIVEYENWFGDLDNPIGYRFGIGSVEILIALLQVVVFVFIEIRAYQKNKTSGVYTGIATVIHAINFLTWVLFYIDWNAWASIPGLLMPQYIVQEILYYIR